MKEIIKLGKFKMESGTARISDPCYDKNTWCAGTIDNVKVGDWIATAQVREGRIARLTACHESVKEIDSDNWVKEKINVGVDSGQAGIYDEKYFKDDKVFAKYKKSDRKYKEAICEEEPWYSWNCDITLSKSMAGTIPWGCVSSSGWGDGEYVCKSIKKGKKVVAISIDYGV